MKAIILTEMGGALSKEDYRFFLSKMFNDKHIIPAPKIFRNLLANFIIWKRVDKGWEKYKLIGKTPIFDSMNAIKNSMIDLISSDDVLDTVFSYSHPTIEEKMSELYNKGIRNFIFLTFYPQYSYTTVESVINDITSFQKKHSDIEYKLFHSYYENSFFINFWKDSIEETAYRKSMKKPHLLFSAHSIPKSIIKKHSDPYQKHVEISAERISNSLNMDFMVSYQSQMNKDKWLGPDTSETIENLISKGVGEIVVIPISFLNENLETIYDLDYKLIPKYNKRVNIGRAKIKRGDKNLIKMFVEFTYGKSSL
ncbi:MAG: ferrochelatase [Candidatus Cloacimonadota bacterium]|nr:MAG: ferrochelatase [Candidatus Cloacimonadota bacterium]PIE78584.1 MAG: ferrochelatase [Candidatus Delongbacteria bacterium]